MPKSLMISYFFLIWAIIQYPLSCVIKVDAGSKFCGLMCTAYFLYLFFTKKDFRIVFKNFCSVIWLILVCYHIWNSASLHVPFEMGRSVLFFKAFLCYFVMVLSAYLFKVDSKRTFSFCGLAYIIYMLCSLSVMSVDESFGGRIKGGVHPNQLAQCAGMFMMMLACYKDTYDVSLKRILKYCLLPFVIMLYCGSRNGLLLLGIFIVALNGKYIFSGSKKRLIFFVFGIVLSVGLMYVVLNHTMLGERMLSTKDQAQMVALKSGTVFDYLGDRGWYYIVGWGFFLESPIRGIGYYNFRNFNIHNLPLHSEYMMHICEGGIIATSMYFLFLMKMLFGRLNPFLRKRTPLNFSLLLCMLSYMFIGITAREFIYSPFYPILGLILYSIVNKNKNEASFSYNK